MFEEKDPSAINSECEEKKDVRINLSEEENAAVGKFTMLFDAIMKCGRLSKEHSDFTKKMVKRFEEDEFIILSDDPEDENRKAIVINFNGLINNCDKLIKDLDNVEKEFKELMEELNPMKRHNGLIVPGGNGIQPPIGISPDMIKSGNIPPMNPMGGDSPIIIPR